MVRCAHLYVRISYEIRQRVVKALFPRDADQTAGGARDRRTEPGAPASTGCLPAAGAEPRAHVPCPAAPRLLHVLPLPGGERRRGASRPAAEPSSLQVVGVHQGLGARAALLLRSPFHFLSAGWLLSSPPGRTEALALFQVLSTASGPPLRPRSLAASSLLYLNG